jgi:hypothetical protein
MNDARLFIEAEWRRRLEVWGVTEGYDCIVCELRERGLIAPEPVDPLLIEVSELAQRYLCSDCWGAEDLALAALRRGMELAERPTLTRGMVETAVNIANIAEGSFVEALHAALVERIK